MMNREELINKLLSYSECDINYENDLYELIELTGGAVRDYGNYLSTHPINCDEELKSLDTADLFKCRVLLTMLLREDHFSNGSLLERFEKGQIKNILERINHLLKNDMEVDDGESVD